MCSVILSSLSERASTLLRPHLSANCIMAVIDDAMCGAISFSRHLAITDPKSLASVACLDLATWMESAVFEILLISVHVISGLNFSRTICTSFKLIIT